MASTNSTVDGLGFEEVNQAASPTDINSLYATGSLQVVGDVITNSNFYDVDGVYQNSAVGSGTTFYGARTQAGSGALSAGSGAWINFPESFASAPTVITQNHTTRASELLLSLGSLNIGSFHVTGVTAADKFGWIAVGL